MMTQVPDLVITMGPMLRNVGGFTTRAWKTESQLISYRRRWAAIAVTAFSALFVLASGAHATVILGHDKITFRNTSTTEAKDFHLTIDGTFRIPPDPASNVFNRAEFNQSIPDTVNFSNGTVAANGGTHEVTFQFRYDTKLPFGKVQTGKVTSHVFTDANGADINNSSRQVYLGATADSNGAFASLSLTNDSGTHLDGSVGVFVDPGFSQFFDSDQFDVLRPGFSTVLPVQSFSFDSGQGFPTITATLSSDQYLLVLGFVSGSAGNVPFAEAFAPVPEPSSFALVGAAVLMGLGYAWRRPSTRCLWG